MIVQDRHGAILEQLAARPRIRLEALQRRLGVSRSTLRRDLMELESLGKVVRLRGLVMHADHLQGEPSYDLRRSQKVSEKQAIGRAAAKLAAANASVFIDAGTTTMEAAKHLLDRGDVRIFTNSLRVVRRAAASQSPAAVTCVGGSLKPVSEALVGASAMSWLRDLRFDLALIGASGLDAEGPSTTELLEADLKRQMIARAKKIAVLADLSKWNSPEAVRFAGWEDVDVLVADTSAPPDLAKVLAKHEVELLEGEDA